MMSKVLNVSPKNYLLTMGVPVWYNIGVTVRKDNMKYDYTVQTIYGVMSETLGSLAEAKQVAKDCLKDRPDCDPVIDQYYKDDELTGEYWMYKNGKFVKAAPPISFKGWIA